MTLPELELRLRRLEDALAKKHDYAFDEGDVVKASHGRHIHAEGEWTPTIIGSVIPGVQTYTLQSGNYTKIGRFVFCSFIVTISAKDAAMDGNLYLGGLPFVSANLSSRPGVCMAFAAGITLSDGYTQLSGYVRPAAQLVRLMQIGSNQGVGYLDAPKLAAAADLAGSFSYIAQT